MVKYVGKVWEIEKEIKTLLEQVDNFYAPKLSQRDNATASTGVNTQSVPSIAAYIENLAEANVISEMQDGKCQSVLIFDPRWVDAKTGASFILVGLVAAAPDIDWMSYATRMFNRLEKELNEDNTVPLLVPLCAGPVAPIGSFESLLKDALEFEELPETLNEKNGRYYSATLSFS